MLKLKDSGKYLIVFTKEQQSHGVMGSKGVLIDGSALAILNQSIDEIDYLDCDDINEYIQCDSNYSQITERWKNIEGREEGNIECHILVFIDIEADVKGPKGSERKQFRILTYAGKVLKIPTL